MATTESSASAHRFVVVEVDEMKTPLETFEVVEGADRIKAMRIGWDLTRARSMNETAKAFALIEIKESGAFLDRVGCAGFARIALVRPKVAVDDLVHA